MSFYKCPSRSGRGLRHLRGATIGGAAVVLVSPMVSTRVTQEATQPEARPSSRGGILGRLISGVKKKLCWSMMHEVAPQFG